MSRPFPGTRVYPVRLPSRTPFHTLFALLAALIIFLTPAAIQPQAYAHTAASSQQVGAGPTYRNPVIGQTSPDPAIIKALDDYYYLIATSDTWQDGTFHNLPIYRSTDLIHWQFVGDAFKARPDWAESTAGLWAPDLQYYNHKYYMYYVVSATNALPKYNAPAGNSAIGVAVADSPAGPWSDVGDSAGGSYQHGPMIPPRPCVYTSDPNCYYATIDPAVFTDQDGQRYMYYGSFFGGTVVQKMAADNLHVTGPLYQVGHWDRYEGTYIIRHDVHGKAYYYNFSSSANCCSGPSTAYSVVVSRATSPLGPFVDQNGFPMERATAPQQVPTTRPSDDPAGDNIGAQGGGYPTLKQNGNTWVGVGHNAIVTDLSGQDWIVYHGVDENNGWVKGTSITYRQLLIDRIDWTADGWPTVNDGAGPSLVNTAPVTTPLFGDNFNASSGCAAPGNNAPLSANWVVSGGAWNKNAGTCSTGGYAEQTTSTGQSLLVSKQTMAPGYRAELDLRQTDAGNIGRYGGIVSYTHTVAATGHDTYVAAFIDPARRELITTAYLDGRQVAPEQATPLPGNFDASDWNHLTINEDVSHPGSPTFHFTLENWDRDPLAVQERILPVAFSWIRGSVGFATNNARADFDNITTARLSTRVAPPQQIPQPGALLNVYSDNFNGKLGPQWSWLREDTTRHGFVNGHLSITVNGDLYRNSNNATNILLESAPSSNYVVETRYQFDPNTNYQQAGLLIYSDDDHYIKVGTLHNGALNKNISGREVLAPVGGAQNTCDVQPSASSNIAIKAYTAQQCPSEGESWDYLANPQPTASGSTASQPTVTNWLRIYRNGNVYTPYSSLDGIHWIKGAAWSLQAAAANFPLKIGLFAFSGGSANTIPIYFDYVHVYRS